MFKYVVCLNRIINIKTLGMDHVYADVRLLVIFLVTIINTRSGHLSYGAASNDQRIYQRTS